MKRQRMNNKGFTLIETTVAMLVMMVVGLGATSLFLYSVRYNSGASQRSIAMAVAQQRLEVLRGAEYDDAGLSFGAHAPETVVITPPTTSVYNQGGSSGVTEPYAAPAASSYASGYASSYASGGGNQASAFVNPNRAPPQPTPTPTPTTGGGGGTYGTPPGSSTYRLEVQVVPFPIGVAVANATQKQITIRVTPLNGNGNNSWSNQNPIEVVFHRSLGAQGPYKE